MKKQVLSPAGKYREVYPESNPSKDPSPLSHDLIGEKEVRHNGKRYIVCLNTQEACKDALDRESILKSLEDKLKQVPKSLVGNKGYRKYLKVKKNSVSINYEKVKNEQRFDGKWVLLVNPD